MGAESLTEAMIVISASVEELLHSILPEESIKKILFDGAIQDKHKTSYSLKETTDRYKESIKSFNRAISLNVGFAFIALYTYFILPANGNVTVPLIDLPITRILWLDIVPFISLVIQSFIFTSFLWFIILRQGLKFLYKEVVSTDEFGDVTNILLDGTLGQIWLIFKVIPLFNTKKTFFVYPSLLLLVATVLISPTVISFYFILQIMIPIYGKILMPKDFILPLVYLVLTLIYMIVFIFLMLVTMALGRNTFDSDESVSSANGSIDTP